MPNTSLKNNRHLGSQIGTLCAHLGNAGLEDRRSGRHHPALHPDGTPDCPGARIMTNGPLAVIEETEVKDATVRDLVRAVVRISHR